MSDTIITRELLCDKMGACDSGPNFIEENNLWGQPDESVILPALRAAGLNNDADWWLDQKKTEKFVRSNGEIITMGSSYQVFNPLTGIHTEYQTETEAKSALAEISKQIIQTHKPTACESLSNENGDSTWVPVDLLQNVRVIIE